MNYYIDTEFIEGPQKKWWGKTKPTIDLIAIGMVDEQGREYCGISKEFNLREAWYRHQVKDHPSMKMNGKFKKTKEYWLRENVLYKVFVGLCILEYGHAEAAEFYKQIDWHNYFTYREMKRLLKKHGKTNLQIADEICEFIFGTPDYAMSCALEEAKKYSYSDKTKHPVFYAYYADYDWVAFCWLFGNMMDLPKDFPMYCRDLKQMLDEKAEKHLAQGYGTHTDGNKKYPKSIEEALNNIKSKKNFPQNENPHDCMADAKFDRALHEFIKTL